MRAPMTDKTPAASLYARLFSSPLDDSDSQITQINVSSFVLPLGPGMEFQVYLEATPRVTAELGLHFDMALGLYVCNHGNWEAYSNYALSEEQARMASFSATPIADLLAANPEWLEMAMESIPSLAPALEKAYALSESETLGRSMPAGIIVKPPRI